MSYSRTRWTLSLTPLLMSGTLLLSGCSSVEEQMTRAPDVRSTTVVETDTTTFSIARHSLPAGMEWVRCPNGQSEGQMQTIGSSGGSITLSAGHRLVVERNAVRSETDFLFVEPRSENIVVNARLVGVDRFSDGAVRLRVSWAARERCTVPDNAVLMRIVPGGTAVQPDSEQRRGVDFIEVRLDSLSTFAIAT